MEKCSRNSVPNVQLRFCILEKFVDRRAACCFVRIQRDIAKVFRIDGLSKEVFFDNVRKKLAEVGIFNRKPLLACCAKILCNCLIQGKRCCVMRCFPDERVEVILHEFLNTHFNFSCVGFFRFTFNSSASVVIPEFIIGCCHSFVLMCYSMHHNGAAIVYHIL